MNTDMNVDDIINIAMFLGDEMTDEQAARLMDEARRNCSIVDMEELKNVIGGPFYTLLSEFEGEMGGFPRY